MEIKRASWHYKISNLGSNFERDDDNLCWYFWRGVGKLVLLLAATIIICSILYGYFTSIFLIPITIMFLFICSLLVLPPLAIHFLRKGLGKSPEMPYGNIVSAYMAARKRKLCPIDKICLVVGCGGL